MSKYPQHDTLKLEQPKSQALHEFILEFLSEKGIFLAQYMRGSERIVPCNIRTEKLVAEFLEIDLDALENEKLAMIEEMRQAHRASEANA